AYMITWYIVYPLYLHPAVAVPGPPVDWIPFAGNFREILREEVMFLLSKKWSLAYGPIFRSYGPMNSLRIGITDPDLLKQIFTLQQYDFVKSPSTARFLSKILGYGLFLAEGNAHKHQRKLLSPAFSLQAVKKLVPTIYEPVFDLLKRWETSYNKASGTVMEVDVSHWMSLLALDVIGLAAFGHAFRSVEHDGIPGKANKLSWAYRRIFDPSRPVLLLVLRLILPSSQHLPIQYNRNYKKALNWLAEESQRLVEQGIERVRKNKTAVDEHVANDHSLLSVMVNLKGGEDDAHAAGCCMSAAELREQCMTFLAAGHETTAVSLSWCLWFLAQHQDVQDALRAEVKPVFEAATSTDKSTLPSFDTVNNLHLLNNVCKETMRITPPVSVTSRIPEKDTTLGGFFIPKGTPIFIHIMAVHHNKKIWGEDAEVFRPSRWDEEPAVKASPYEYLPFLAGGRQCIGYRFALIEFKIILGHLLTKYQFFEKPGFRPKKKVELTLRPAPNMTLLVKPISAS
ncbi:cytochrome P450, partial [Dichotomocladium elegans]